MCQENQATNGHRMLRNDGQVEGGENDRFGRHRSDVARAQSKRDRAHSGGTYEDPFPHAAAHFKRAVDLFAAGDDGAADIHRALFANLARGKG